MERLPYIVGVGQGKATHSVQEVEDGSPSGVIPGTTKLLECLS